MVGYMAPKLKSITPDAHSGSIRSFDCVVREAILAGEVPGAVLDVAGRGRTVFRRCYGHRALVPKQERMTLTTIFDLASVTKVVATATASALLVESGELSLRDRAHRFLPGLGCGRKREIMVEHLLTHTSGLPAYDNYLKRDLGSAGAILADICGKKLCHAPGTRFLYSDLGAILMAKIVEIVYGEPLDEFCAQRIFGPLGMVDTGFSPSAKLIKRCAPTAHRRGKLLRGEVHDENAFALEGAAGHAGLFSTVRDLRCFADMILAEGWTPEGVFLKPETIREFLRPRRIPDGNMRALGWGVNTPYSSARGHVFPIGSVGHTGFTGTSIWLDPPTRTSVILLTNRVHPDDGGDAKPLRAKVASIAAATVNTGQPQYAGGVESGLDVWLRDGCPQVRGKHIGLVTNHTAIDRTGNHILDHLLARDEATVSAIFSPEHGFEGQLDEKIQSSVHAETKIPIHSLYGKHIAPAPEMLDGLEALVFDIQDIGARFYTYSATMALCMNAAAQAGIPFVVLDRPNPINGIDRSGPVLRRARGTLTAYYRVPLRHGLTMGELAHLANARLRPQCELIVVKTRGWQRAMFFDETGLPWVNPSPNLRNLKQAILYPAIGAIEFSNLSVGRGTDTPFELFGAPWIDPVELCDTLNCSGLPGVTFSPIWFKPSSSRYQGERCGGVYIMLDHRIHFRPDLTTLTVVRTLWHLYGRRYDIGKVVRLLGEARAITECKKGVSPQEIVKRWQPHMVAFADSVHGILMYS